MIPFFKGFNTTVFSLLMTCITFVVFNNFPHIWHPWLELLGNALFVALGLTIVFSAQFNHSRLSILSIVFLLLALTQTYQLPWSNWLADNTTWLYLHSVFLLAGLSFIKDRGLISIHGIWRIAFLLLSALAAYLWQVFSIWLINFLTLEPIVSNQALHYSHYLMMEVPFIAVSLLLTWRSLTQISSLSAALLVTCLFWIFTYYQIIDIAWQVSYFVFAVYYLLVVIVDSYFLAYRDDLTGLPSRRALNQLALSLGRKYTVAMLDIDHFKKFNDTYGHDIGDQVLKLVAARIGDVKGGGKAFRYGGEEFTIVFPRKNIEQVRYALESVRQTIADYNVVIRHPLRSTKQARRNGKSEQKKTVNVTISIGVANRENKQDFPQVIKVADQALYRAKKKGRNNVST